MLDTPLAHYWMMSIAASIYFSDNSSKAECIFVEASSGLGTFLSGLGNEQPQLLATFASLTGACVAAFLDIWQKLALRSAFLDLWQKLALPTNAPTVRDVCSCFRS